MCPFTPRVLGSFLKGLKKGEWIHSPFFFAIFTIKLGKKRNFRQKYGSQNGRWPIRRVYIYIYIHTYIHTYMLESYFQYHVLAFQELETVPPQELETVPPLEGPLSHYKNRFLRLFVTHFGAN